MSYYKYDKKTLERIREINDKISKEQQQIFDILLKISQSFSDENFSKEQRNKLFDKVDILKQNIKEYNEKLKEIKSNKKVDNIKSEVEKTNYEANEENKSEENFDVKKMEKENKEFVDTVEKLEEVLKESEYAEKENNIKNSFENKNEKSTFFKRKKARTQLVVVDDDSIAGKVKEIFSKLSRFLKSKK